MPTSENARCLETLSSPYNLLIAELTIENKLVPRIFSTLSLLTIDLSIADVTLAMILYLF